MSEQIGPHLHLTASCSGCKYERSVSYRVQGDSGHDIYCDHPNEPGRSVGDTSWNTPDWCPEGARMLEFRTITKGIPPPMTDTNTQKAQGSGAGEVLRDAAASIADGERMSGNDQWSVGYDAAARKIARAIRSIPLS